MTQAEFVRRLDRAQSAVGAMERTEDHMVSTVWAVVVSLGGHLELTARVLRPNGIHSDQGTRFTSLGVHRLGVDGQPCHRRAKDSGLR